MRHAARRGTPGLGLAPWPRRARAVAAIALAACALSAHAGTVTGKAAYRERMALPSGATFEAALEDVSRADAPAVILGRFGPVPATVPPFPFTISFDDAKVTPQGRYNVRASVRHEGRLLFTTDRYTAALGRDRPLDLRLVKVTGTPTPPATATPLRNTYWKLVALKGKPAQAFKDQREPHLVFKADELRVSGSGGCNNLAGGFTLEGDRLALSQMAGTMMACPHGMEQEAAFLATLATIARYRIAGDALTLFDAKGRALAKFRAVALR